MTASEARPRATPPTWLWALLGAITLYRLWAAARIPLSEDEAYYRLWAQHLQLGYYDHPPMIAWWIRAGMTLAGDSPLGVRLLPCLSCLATSLMVFDLAGRLGLAPPVAARAAVWSNATLLIGAGGLLAAPDAASVPFWTLTLWCLARIDGPRAPAWWAAAGAAAGLACLSKYSALFLAPGVVLWLVSRPGGLAQLRRPWPWLAVLIAAGVFGLNVAWNASHGWASFIKQFGRAAPGHFAPRFEIELIVGQFLLLNPFIAAFVLRALGRRGRAAPSGADLGLVLLTAAPFCAYLLVHALHDRVQAHWPVPVYPGLAIAAAAAASGPLGVGYRIARALAAPFGLGLAVLVLGHLALPASDLGGAKDPASPLRGWSDLAAHIEADRLAHHAAWIGTFSYGVSAQLAAQPAIHAPVLELAERDRYAMDPAAAHMDLSGPGLALDLDRRISAARLSRCFWSVTPLGARPRGQGAGRDGHYLMFRVQGPKLDVAAHGCPAAP